MSFIDKYLNPISHINTYKQHCAALMADKLIEKAADTFALAFVDATAAKVHVFILANKNLLFLEAFDVEMASDITARKNQIRENFELKKANWIANLSDPSIDLGKEVIFIMQGDTRTTHELEPCERWHIPYAASTWTTFGRPFTSPQLSSERPILIWHQLEQARARMHAQLVKLGASHMTIARL